MCELISVVVICYNQENFIAQALESILSQSELDKIHIYVGDDCSLDSTPNILMNYKKQYADLFSVFLREKNLGPAKNLYDLLQKCRGEYIAILEGDDYWTNSEKLLLQSSFLNQNRHYIACTHRYSCVDQDGKVLQTEYSGPGKPNSGVYSLSDFEEYKYFGHLATLFFRNIFQDNLIDTSIIIKGHNFIADLSLNLLLSLNGDVYVAKHNLAAMRIVIKQDGSNYKSTINKKCQIKDRILMLDRMRSYSEIIYNVNLNFLKRDEHYLLWSLIYAIKYPSKHNFDNLCFTFNRIVTFRLIFTFPKYCIFKIPKLIKLLKRYRS